MSDPRPNILWICTDSQRWDTLGCYGNRFVRTPNIDRLAADGVLFENTFAQNPLCQPSRACMLTGRYPVTTRLRQNGQDIPEDTVLVTKLLADAGYVGGLSGKLHLSACDRRIERCGPEWWKHDASLYFSGSERRIDDGYAEFQWDHAPGGTHRSSAYTRWLFEQGHAVRTPPREDCGLIHHGMPEALHQTKWCADRAIDFLTAYASAPHPWFYSVNIFDPHFSFNPPDEYLEPYLKRLDELPLPAYRDGELDEKPPYQKQFSEHGKFDRRKLTSSDHRYLKAAYWAMCDLIDVHVGRMLDALDRTGQRQRTLVLFTSDHGELLGDHGMYHKGPFLYEGALRVPLIASMPGTIPSGRRTATLVELGDLAPTLLDAAGLPRHPGMQAKSLWPLLSSASASGEHREDVYCEYYNSNNNKPPQYCTMLRTATHKLVAWHGQPLGELYDLQADPTELHNLWDRPEHAAIKAQHLQRLCARMAFTCDPLPPRVGIY
ncbi:MAG: sulfatase-like hydrolase/transferase [Planctomycetes bacterium]|nr:sulfatase-like hydrolase/transferase [Planctomycetota bacterium]